MNELFRFSATGQNGINILFPPKFEFVFYNNKFEIYKKGKLVRTISYEDVEEVKIVKNWQNNEHNRNIYKKIKFSRGIWK